MLERLTEKWNCERRSIMEENVLYIAEILYETGEIHYRYSRKISDDGVKWILYKVFRNLQSR